MLNVFAIAALYALLAVELSAQLPALSPAHLNPAIAKLASGKTVYGVLTQDLSRENARILGRRDADSVYVDMEHSPLNMDALANFVAAMNDKAYTVKNGAQPRATIIARMPASAGENAAWQVKQALDIGVMGFVFNTVETREQAEMAVTSMRYPTMEEHSQHAQRTRRRSWLVAGRGGLGVGYRYGGISAPGRCLAAQSRGRSDGDHDHRDPDRREECRCDCSGARRHRPERRCWWRPVVIVTAFRQPLRKSNRRVKRFCRPVSSTKFCAGSRQLENRMRSAS